jgi:hypothetical protein
MDATIIASVKNDQLCHAHQYQISATFIFHCASSFGSVPIDLLIIDLVHAEILDHIVDHIFHTKAKIVPRDNPINKQQIRNTPA